MKTVSDNTGNGSSYRSKTEAPRGAVIGMSCTGLFMPMTTPAALRLASP